MAQNLRPVTKPAKDIISGEFLVGDTGNRALVYEVKPSSSLPGLIAVETEFGFLYLDANPSQLFTVLEHVWDGK